MALQASAQAYHYDVNNDKQVNVTDIMLVVNKILGNTTEPEEHPLTITVSENPLISSEASGPQQGPRRSPEVTTESLKLFDISWMYEDPIVQGDYYYFNENGQSSYTYEIGSPGYYENSGSWPSPIADDKSVIPLTVFGFNSGELEPATDFKPYLKFECEESADNQTDLIVAKNSKTWNQCHGIVNLEFNHVCSAFQFSIKKSSGMAAYNIEVAEVVLHNIIKKGNYYLLNNRWVLDNVYTDYTLKSINVGNISLDGDDTQTVLLNPDDKNYLFLIPQPITSMAKGTPIATADNEKKSYIEISCKIKNSDGLQLWPTGANSDGFGSVYLPFNPTFSNTEGKMKPGYIYPIIINIGTSIRDADGNKISLQ